MAPHGVFPSAGDDRWVSIAVVDDDAWRRMSEAIGCPELGVDARFATLAGRKRHEDHLDEIVAAWTTARSPEDATEALQRAGVAAFTVASNRDLADDPHLIASGAFVRLEHPEVGSRLHIGPPWHTTRYATAVRRAAPCLGADTDAVLVEICGYSMDEVHALRAAGVLR